MRTARVLYDSWRNVPASSSIARFLNPIRTWHAASPCRAGRRRPAASSLASSARPAGRAWRDRLDERGAERALAIAQRHGVPELLARILAGRGVEVEEVAGLSRSDRAALMPDPDALADMRCAATRLADAVADGETHRHLRRLRRRRGDRRQRCSRDFPAPLRALADHPHPRPLFEGYGPNVEAIRALAGRGATLLVTVDCGTTSHEPLRRSAAARPRRHRDRPSSGR